MVDEKLLRAALGEYGMKATVCPSCKEMTLYVENEAKNNTPTNCGGMKCMKALSDPLAVYTKWKP